MLIAVTGATGFLGRYIVNELTHAGHRCRCWHRASSDRGGFDNDDAIEWIEGDLNDAAASTNLVQGVDAVVHSALMRPTKRWGGGEGDLVQFARTNIVGSLRLMQDARQAEVPRFAFISTCAVHDVILQDRKLDEAHPTWPKTHYGAHKAAIEAFVHSYGLGEGWPICALRPTGIYGVARPIDQSKWFNIVRDVKAGKPISDASGGKEVHAADVARAVALLLGADASQIAGQSFNCYDMYIAVQDIARIAAAATGSRSDIADLNRGPKNQIDTSKLRALGMTFGGKALLEQTVRAMADAI